MKHCVVLVLVLAVCVLAKKPPRTPTGTPPAGPAKTLAEVWRETADQTWKKACDTKVGMYMQRAEALVNAWLNASKDFAENRLELIALTQETVSFAIPMVDIWCGMSDGEGGGVHNVLNKVSARLCAPPYDFAVSCNVSEPIEGSFPGQTSSGEMVTLNATSVAVFVRPRTGPGKKTRVECACHDDRPVALHLPPEYLPRRVSAPTPANAATASARPSSSAVHKSENDEENDEDDVQDSI